MSLITIFTAPKPFTNPHIALIQRNAILSWKNLGREVDVILIGDEPGIADFAEEAEVRHLPEVSRNSRGTPYISSIFNLAHENSSSPLLACINADMITLPDFMQAARDVQKKLKDFLIVGQRWDLDVREPVDFSPGWDERIRKQVAECGRIHPPTGSDYFIYPRHCFTEMPDFVIGRPGWDNWTIYSARWHGWALVDASQGVTIVHQDHDYSHLPGGRPPYGGPEAGENRKQMGSRREVFFPYDGNWALNPGGLRRPKLTWKRFWREVEIFPLSTLHSRFLGQVFYAIFHPVMAFREFRAEFGKKRHQAG
jgi:hypothetical protein